MEPKITTVIPAFRRPQLLKRAVNSILSQTYPHFEVCVYDDNSGDETEDVMREFTLRDTRVKYYRQPQNVGMMKNYEFGHSRITTPYFSFLSDDDYLLPEFYETALKDLEQNPKAAFSACPVNIINSQGQVLSNSNQLWDKKGYFDSPEGLIEMISPIFKPPILSCILFNQNVIGGIPIDWSDEIQLLCDVNFLLGFAAQFPYVINDKISGFFLAHDDGFSSGFYSRLRRSSQEMEVYMKASSRLLRQVTGNQYLSHEVQLKVRKLLLKYHKGLINNYIQVYVSENKIRDAFQTIKLTSSYFGGHLTILVGIAKGLLDAIKR